MELREQIARAICGNWVVGEDRPWMQWAEEADAVIEVLAQKELVAYAIGGEIERIRGELAAEKAWVAEYRDQASKLHLKLEELRQQKPVAWLRAPDKNNRRKLSFERPTGSSQTKALWSPLYLAPGAQWGYVRGDAQAAVPDGWKLVPIEPTPEMLARTSAPGCAKSDWEKMIAAAPKPENE